jgi:hypothetical protein
MSGIVNRLGSHDQTKTPFGSSAPCCAVELSSAQANISSSVLVLFNSVNYDPTGDFDTSTGKFTPSVAGTYFVWVMILGHNVSNSYTATGQINKNTTAGAHYRINGNFAGEQITYNMYGDFQCNGTTDTLSANCAFSGGTVSQINSGNQGCKMFINKVG